MMGSAPSAVPPDQLSVLRALARLLDPGAGPEIERIVATLGRDDVRRALEGLHECIGLITALTPLAPAVERAIADLEQREADLAARESRLVKREAVIASALKVFGFGEDEHGEHQ
jgi:hypothetical protein